MTGLLLSRKFVDRFGEQLASVEAEAGVDVEHIILDVDEREVLTPEQLARVDAAFLSNDARYDRQFVIETLVTAPNLQWVHAFSVGIDKTRYPELRERGITLTNSPGANAAPIALTVLGAMVWLNRPFAHWADAQKRRAWDPIHYDHAPSELQGQCMVIIGTGEIGSRIARHAQHLGLHVVGVRRGEPRPDDPLDEVHHPAALDELLPRADWLVIACPLTDETRGLVGEHALSLLPAGARLINVSRGQILVQDAFIAAVQAGQIAGAYLDVADPEPLPPDSPLWDLPNVLVSPHNSAVSSSYPRESAERFFANLVRWCRGEPLVGVV